MLQLALQFLLKNNDDDEQCLYNPEQNKTTKCTGGEVCPMPRGFAPPHNVFLFFFHIKIVRADIFSCTNSTVLFAIKYRGRYVIILYSWRLTVKDMKTSRFHKSCKVIAIQSVTRVLLLFFNYRAFIFQTVERPCQAHHTSIGYVLARSGT